MLDSFPEVFKTVLAAMQCGRRAIAIEEDPLCFQLTVRRVDKPACTPRDSTEAGTNATITPTILTPTIFGNRVHLGMCDSFRIRLKHDRDPETDGVRLVNESQTFKNSDTSLSSE